MRARTGGSAQLSSKRQVYLHIGAPKSGTTHVQDRLTRNARQLAKHGVHVPNLLLSFTPARTQFRAALDLLDQDWGGPEGHAAGHWERLVAKVHRTEGTVVISHEILAPAPPAAIDKALNDLGRDDVHIIYTARDLGSELTSAWQESVRMGRPWHLRRFLRLARKRRNWFARALDLPTVLEAWGRDLDPERIHVVTVPPASSGSPDALWHRFCDVLGVPPSAVPRPAKRSNPSLDAVATELIRRLNVRYGAGPHGDPNRDRYVAALRTMLAHHESARVPIDLPPQDHAWVTERAREQIAWIAEHGVSVHGDVDDLLPAAPTEGWVDPDRLPRAAVLELALDALHGTAATHADQAARGDRTITAVRKRVLR